MDPLSISSGIAGLICLAQGLIPPLIAYVDDVQSFPAEFSDLVAEIRRLCGVLCVLQPVYESIEASPRPQSSTQKGVTSVILEQLTTCKADLEEFAELLSKFNPRASKNVQNCLKKIVWGLKQEKRGNIIKRLERHKKMLELAMHGLSTHILNEEVKAAMEERQEGKMHREVTIKEFDESKRGREDVNKWMDQRQLFMRREILQWLFSASLSGKHNAIRAKRVRNTGQWLLQDTRFKSWVSGTSVQLLFCMGIAGSGKSMLMFTLLNIFANIQRSTAIDYLQTHFQNQNVAVAYIYFDYKDRENQTAIRVVSALLKQVVSQLETTPQQIQQLYEESIRRAWLPDLTTLVEHLISCVCLFQSVYVVLDALDECEDDQQKDILTLLDELLVRPSVQLMLTSRSHLQRLKQLSVPSLRIDITADERDVRTYLHSRLEHERLSPDLRNEIVEVISQGAEGMFLLVEFQLHYVLSKREPRRLEAAIRTKSLPKQIHEAYEEILQRIEREGSYTLAVKILSWIFHARGPLSMDELCEALSIDIGDSRLNSNYFLEPATIVEVCKSLVTYDEANGIVRFTHHTVQDYLESRRPQILLNIVDLAKTLLTYLSFDIFKEPWNDPTELKARIQDHKLSGYASRSWSDYARGEGEHDRELQRLVFGIFDSQSHIKTLLYLETMGEMFPPNFDLTLLQFSIRHRLSSICRMIVAFEEISNPNSRRRTSVGQSRMEVEVTNLPIECVVQGDTVGNIHSRDRRDRTPLHLATEIGCQEIVMLLLEAGAYINAKSSYEGNLTPLHLAVYYGHENVVGALINRKANMEVKWGYRGETPLLLAARLGRVAILEKLIKKGANIAASIEGVGETAVMQAIHTPNVIEVVQLLLRAGADPNVTDVEGRTAVHYALQLCPQKECIQLLECLIGAGANVNIPSLDGSTPLHTAAYIDLRDRMHDTNLRKLKAKFSKDSINEVYAYRCAVQEAPFPRRADVEGEGAIAEIVKLLLVCGARGTPRNLDGDNPLQCAIKNRNEEAALILFWDVEGKVEFTMDRLGDQEFLNKIKRLCDEMRGCTLNSYGT